MCKFRCRLGGFLGYVFRSEVIVMLKCFGEFCCIFVFLMVILVIGDE